MFTKVSNVQGMKYYAFLLSDEGHVLTSNTDNPVEWFPTQTRKQILSHRLFSLACEGHRPDTPVIPPRRTDVSYKRLVYKNQTLVLYCVSQLAPLTGLGSLSRVLGKAKSPCSLQPVPALDAWQTSRIAVRLHNPSPVRNGRLSR